MQEGWTRSCGLSEGNIALTAHDSLRLCAAKQNNPVCLLTKKFTTQVFFRAGVLGQMEELRDDRLSKIMTWLQSWIRGFLSRKEYKKLQDQRRVLKNLI
jgi:hypothetical protein